jgi:Spy/CpxP family protein refolding chaperone
MRKMIVSSVMVLTLAVAGSAAMYAQAPDQGQGPRPHGQFQRGGMMNPEFEVKMLTKRLNLTPEQVGVIQPILADSHARMKALKPAEGTTPDFKALREQHKAIMDDTNAKLNAVLTPEQQAEFAKMHEHRGPHGGPGGPHGNWKGQGGTTPPAPTPGA